MDCFSKASPAERQLIGRLVNPRTGGSVTQIIESLRHKREFEFTLDELVRSGRIVIVTTESCTWAIDKGVLAALGGEFAALEDLK